MTSPTRRRNGWWMSRSIGHEPRRNRRNILSPCWGIETGTDDRLSVYDRLGNRRNRDPSIECVQSCLKIGVVIDPLREFVADDRDSADSGESCNALYPVDVRKIREDGRVEDARIRRDGVRRYSRVNSSSLPVSSPSVPSSNSSSVAASASSAASVLSASPSRSSNPCGPGEYHASSSGRRRRAMRRHRA